VVLVGLARFTNPPDVQPWGRNKAVVPTLFIQKNFSLANDKLPKYGNPAELTSIVIKPRQVIVWVSITPLEDRGPPPAAPLVPALLDMGSGHNFSVRPEHVGWDIQQLRQRMEPDDKRWPWVRDISNRKVKVPLLLANLWLYPELPGEQGSLAPHFIHLGQSGITCYDADAARAKRIQIPEGPRMGVFGMGALCAGYLSLHIEANPMGGTALLFIP